MSDGCTEMLREEMLEEGWHEYADKYDQPPPVKNNLQPVWKKVMADLAERAEVGKRRYGTYLQPNNGRDALLDAYQETQDLLLYLGQLIMERDGK